MATHVNPFPGMNPFLEGAWSDVHTRLISYISDTLAPELPEDLVVRAEERVVVGGHDEERPLTLRADVAVVEQWRHGFPPLWSPEGGERTAMAVDEPLIVQVEAPTERWVEVRTGSGELVTVVEVLSPANKGSGRERYLQRQRTYGAAGVSLVEIDLLRRGAHTVDVETELLPRATGTRYTVCVARPYLEEGRREVYLAPLRQRLPTIRVPLRWGDPDVPLAIQPLLNRCYEMGRHGLSAYRQPLSPPLPEEEAAWVEEVLRGAGVAGPG